MRRSNRIVITPRSSQSVNKALSGDGRIVPFVEGARLCQNHPSNPCDFGRKGDCHFVNVHSALELVYPDTKAIARPIQMIDARSRPVNQQSPQISIAAPADAEE
jgi:hypothetical protein